ncbi:MAG: hypothetical protein JJU15_09845 [Pararhodobacter sp.]|nr:hypothetical protein [Pararhodobacter sp.]
MAIGYYLARPVASAFSAPAIDARQRGIAAGPLVWVSNNLAGNFRSFEHSCNSMAIGAEETYVLASAFGQNVRQSCDGAFP